MVLTRRHGNGWKRTLPALSLTGPYWRTVVNLADAMAKFKRPLALLRQEARTQRGRHDTYPMLMLSTWAVGVGDEGKRLLIDITCGHNDSVRQS